MEREALLSVAKPILFNTDMVRAILDGRKSMTRRVVKPQPILYGLLDPNFDWSRIKRPYHPEDILYVRETWSEWTDGYVYRAWTSPFPQLGRYPDEFMTWHPSIHMPKEAARIFLRVTDVRVERLHDMTLDDFLAEGVVIRPEAFNDPENAYWQAREIFSSIWDSTIPKKDLGKYGFDANPWEWAYGFERVEV